MGKPYTRHRASSFDPLEPRTLFSTFVVTNTNNSGAGSLYQAIVSANATSAADTITFNIPGAGVKTIAPTALLPAVTHRLTIDATTQPGYAIGAPKVALDGNAAALADPMNDDLDGLRLEADQSEVRGLVIERWSGDGVQITADDCTVQACFIGTNTGGLVARPNGHDGVRIDGGSGNLVGGTSSAQRNVISGNTMAGVSIKGDGAHDNTVSGNYIGLASDGAIALANDNGVWISAGAHDNTIGGTSAGAHNVISANDNAGVNLHDADTTGNRIRGNYIGTDATGLLDRGNAVGVAVTEAGDFTIGGDTPAHRNVISGNQAGIGLGDGMGGNAYDVRVYGNYIGTTPDGLAALPNNDGVSVYGADGVHIGGLNAGQGNVISGNDSQGLSLISFSDGAIEGNYIGVDATGDAPLGNATGGVFADGVFSFTNNSVRRNVISANGGYGFRTSVGGGHANGNTFQGNFIGTNHDGTAPLGNVGDGMEISGSDNLVGGTGAGDGNVISANGGDGLILRDEDDGFPGDFFADDNLVLGNRIGADVTGASDFGNGGNGVVLRAGDEQDGDDTTHASVHGNVIGDGTTAGRNVISGNAGYGVLIDGANASGNFVRGNYIGTNAKGTKRMANGSGVVLLHGAAGNRVGGDKAGQGNLISGNDGNGVTLNSGATGTQIRGNRIGTAADGTSALGNTGNGIAFGTTAGDGNIVGYDGTGVQNTIAFNGVCGIRVNGGTGQALWRNSVFGNGAIGIDLGTAGVTPNDGFFDFDGGPNWLQNYPIITSAKVGKWTVKISGSLASSPNTTFTIQFFADPAPSAAAAEGRTYLGSVTVKANAIGSAAFSPTLKGAVAVGTFVTALATSSTGNTSEFSAPVAASV